MADLPKSNNTQYAYLSQLSVDELMELLVNAPVPASTPEEEAYVEALKEAIIKKENGKPTGILPDVDKAWAEFQENCEFLEESPGGTRFNRQINQPPVSQEPLSCGEA